MKSYSIHQDDSQPAPLQTATEYAEPATEKTGFVLKEHRKAILAVIALIIAGFLLIKLQKPENYSQVVATAATVSQPAKTLADSPKKLRQKEVENPAVCIKGDLSWRKNLVGETVLKGTLNNSATQTNFKDPVILITWLSKTNTALGTTSYPLYEYLAAGKTIPYKLKVKAPFKYSDARIAVESATPIK